MDYKILVIAAVGIFIAAYWAYKLEGDNGDNNPPKWM
jgi:hypothetical protein